MIPTEHTYTEDQIIYLKPDYVNFLNENNLLIEASAGGLISGPSLAQGGISLVGINRDSKVFVAARVEGWMFLLNYFAYLDNEDRVKPLFKPSFMGDSLFHPHIIPAGISVLDVSPRQVGEEVITPVLYNGVSNIGWLSKGVAQQNLKFLDDINRAAWHKHYTIAQPEMTIRVSAAIARHDRLGDN